MNRTFENINDFQNIFKEYYNPLLNFINSYLHNIENSKEVVQNTFLKVWENRLNIDVNSSVKSYLFQMAKNTMIDYIRKNKKYSLNLELNQELEQNFMHVSTEVIDPYIIKNAVLKVMTKLKPKNKEIFELHKFEGLTYMEIADYLNISKRTVEDNISRTLKYLKDELKDHPDFFD